LRIDDGVFPYSELYRSHAFSLIVYKALFRVVKPVGIVALGMGAGEGRTEDILLVTAPSVIRLR
jgi:hypothetical protein